MEIRLLTPVFPSPRRGEYPGIERFAEGLCKGFEGLGHKVRVITTFRNGGAAYQKLGSTEVYRLSDFRRRFGRPSGIFELDALSFGLSALRNQAILDGDLLILNGPFPFLGFTRRRTRTVGILHHREPLRKASDLLTVPFGSIYQALTRPDVYVAPSRNTAREFGHMLKSGNGRIEIVSEGVDAGTFNTRANPSRVRSKFGEKKTILYVGSLTKNKGVNLLIDALAVVRKSIDDAQLIIVGDGPLREKLQQQVALLGLRNAVHFVGFIADEELPAFYAACDLFATASTVEGFGLTLLEAMASGKPIVAFRASSVPEVVGTAGILVSPTKINELSGAIQELLTNEHLRSSLSEIAARRASSFSWENSARRIIELAA